MQGAPGHQMTRALALGLTLLTGFSGLVYEITWQKYLATLLGSHSEATAAVLGLYLGGLAAGEQARLFRTDLPGAVGVGNSHHQYSSIPIEVLQFQPVQGFFVKGVGARA